MTSRCVLVDGAGGFVGRHVVEALARRGHAVRATDRDGSGIPDIPGVERDVRDLATAPLDDLLEGVTDLVHVPASSTSPRHVTGSLPSIAT